MRRDRGGRTRGWALAILAALWAQAGLCAPGEAAQRTVTVGLVDTFSPEFYVESYAPTVDGLIEALPQYRFRVVEVDENRIGEEVAREKVDFLVSSASSFLSLIDEPGAHQVATRHAGRSVDASKALSSAIVVRSSSRARSLGDLRGARLAVPSLRSFDGWQIAASELTRRGFDPKQFFSSVRETQYAIPGVATLVRFGMADAGVLGTCELESLVSRGVLEKGELRVLEDRSEGKGCARSTGQYPDAVMASLPWVESDVVRDVTVALLSLPEKRLGFRWVVESDFRSTWQLLKDLRIGPFANLRDVSPRAIWQRYRTEILLAALLFAAVLFHLVALNLLVRRRTAQLAEAAETTKRLYRETQETHSRLNNLERTSIVSSLSSMFAHEVKQPIMNLSLYAGALLTYLKKKGKGDEKTDELLAEMKAEISRSVAIIDHVRSYAKKRQSVRQRCDLAEIANESVKAFADRPAFLRLRLPARAPVLADPFEIQFIVTNFLKNAFAAVEKGARPDVFLELRPDSGSWRLFVADNGPAIPEEVFARLGRATASAKEDGLGFGLAIATGIAERNGGHLEFDRREGGGLIASLLLPQAPEGRPKEAQ